MATGRSALMEGKPKDALPQFQAVSQENPDYLSCIDLYCVGIWTYLGRTYHEMGDNFKAVESLNRGRDRHRRDKFAKVYLGLVMAPSSPLFRTQSELDAGLEGLNDWLVNLANNHPEGHYWDPSGRLKRAIADTRKKLKTDKINWDKVQSDVRWLAVNFEEEAEAVRQEARNGTGTGIGDD